MTKYFLFCEEIYSYFETNEIEYHANIIWQNILNTLFEEEHVCHRMVNGFITDVLDDTEITSINNAIESQDNVSSRMQKALKALYKDNDTQTAIRESIEAVEAMCKTKTNSTSGTLANAIDQLRRENKIHPALADGLKKNLRLYQRYCTPCQWTIRNTSYQRNSSIHGALLLQPH